MLAAHSGDDGLVGQIAKSMTEAPEGMYVVSPGTFTNVAPPRVQLAEVQRGRCFQHRALLGGRPRSALGDGAAEEARRHLPPPLSGSRATTPRDAWREASPAERDAAFSTISKSRKTMGQVIHRFFGDPGLQVAAARYAGPEHETAIALLRQRLTDPGFASALGPMERAELELLAAAPLDFVSCVARRAQGQNKG